MMNKIIVNCETNDQTIVQMSTEEIQAISSENSENELLETQKQADKISALSKLQTLGLTEDEIKALIG